jgi:microcystin-dependent protein
MKIKYLWLIALLISNSWAAQPTSFTYQGKALNAAGTAPLTTTVSFTLSITDPSGACILYQEGQTGINLSTTNGLFALQVGSALGSKRTVGTDPGLTMTQIFANAGTQLVAASGSCTSGYTPAVGDTRKLHVVVTPTSGSPITISPDLSINSVPNSLVADSLQGSSLSQVQNPVGTLISYIGSTCPSGYLASDTTVYSTTTYPNLFSLVGYTYGGSGTSFSLPNTSGLFLRGAGSQTLNGITYSATEGTTQNDQLQGHSHSTSDAYSFGSGSGVYMSIGGSNSNGYQAITGGSVPSGLIGPANVSDGTNGTPRTGAETRPANFAVKYCVKY